MDRRIGLAVAAIFLLLLLLLAWRSAFWILVFLGLASLAELYQLYFKSPVHLELIKLGTILSAVTYGAGPALLVGLAATAFSKFFSQTLDVKAAFSFIAISLVVFAAVQFSTLPITWLGISLVALYYVITTPLMLLLGEDPFYALTYVATNIVWNALLFLQVAPRILPLL